MSRTNVPQVGCSGCGHALVTMSTRAAGSVRSHVSSLHRCKTRKKRVLTPENNALSCPFSGGRRGDVRWYDTRVRRQPKV